MSIDSSGDWNIDTDRALVALSSTAESGSGGGDMTIFSLSREFQLRRLVQGTYTNSSSYTLPSGIVDAETTYWQEGFENGELTPESPTTGVTGGIGGGDMRVYTQDRVPQLKKLIQSTFTNASRFTLPLGIIGIEKSYWDRNFDETEETPTLPSNSAEAGSGGGDMAIWERDIDTQVRRLVLGTFTNASRFDIDGGVVDIEKRDWNARFEGNRVYLDEPDTEEGASVPEVVQGDGGDDMFIFTRDRVPQLRNLVVGNYTNNAAYTIPAGIVDNPTTSWGAGFDTQEQTFIPTPTVAQEGEGGGTIAVLTGPRRQILEKLVEGDYGNLTGEPLPDGIVNTRGFDTVFEDSELGLGATLRGRVLKPSGSPLSGTVQIVAGGEILKEVSVSGSFKVTVGDPPSIVAGENADATIYNYRFIPAQEGIAAEVEDSGTGTDIGVVQYGTLKGKVLDVDGNPVQGASIVGPGNSVATDSTGEYEFFAPGGIDVDIQGLDKSVEKTTTVPAAGTAELDFQYAGVTVQVRFANGEGVPGVDVLLDEAPPSRESNSAGNVRYTEVPVNTEVNIEIAGEFSQTFDSPNEGVSAVRTQYYDAGIVGQILNDLTGESIGAVDISFGAPDAPVTRAKPDGKFAAASIDPGDLTLYIAEEDRRFKTKTINATISRGEVLEENIRLEPAANISTY